MTKDEVFMERALHLAEMGGVVVAPNPKVGAVIVHNDKIIGEGFHKTYGKAHAEVNAINAVKHPELLKESTIYVTLEPCSHYGKTPPCADLIIKYQFKKVVVATLDPNKKVSGRGINKIREAGIAVTTGIVEKKARELNKRFFTFHQKKRPYVILKWAKTADGFMDLPLEKRGKGINWITPPHLKLHVHQWRSKEQAIMVGWKTVNNDNPQLNVRKIVAPSPHRFIIDPQGKVHPKSALFHDGHPSTIITTNPNLIAPSTSSKVIQIEKLSTSSILDCLYKSNILSVFIEGGATTLQHFINDRLWDEAYQLTGKTKFYAGLPAPQLSNHTLIDETSIENCSIQHYKKI